MPKSIRSAEIDLVCGSNWARRAPIEPEPLSLDAHSRSEMTAFAVPMVQKTLQEGAPTFRRARADVEQIGSTALWAKANGPYEDGDLSQIVADPQFLRRHRVGQSKVKRKLIFARWELNSDSPLFIKLVWS